MLTEAERQAVVERVHGGRKYRTLDRLTIEDAVEAAATTAHSQKEAERSARRTLHAVKSDYLLSASPRQVEARLRRCASEHPDDVAVVCAAALEMHKSSAERTIEPVDFYPALVELAGGAEELTDIACAMGPFCLPLIRGVIDCPYRGIDLNRFYVELPVRILGDRFDGVTQHLDVSFAPQRISTDVALFMKTYHSAEARRRGLGLAIVDGVDARCVVVTFPLRSFGGRPLRETTHHVDRLRAAAAERGWRLDSSEFGDELAVAVHKGRHG